MIYELWDTTSLNLVGSFSDEAAALDAVCRAVTHHGETYVEGLALIQENAQGESQPVAEGRDLRARAMAAAVHEAVDIESMAPQ